MLSQENSKPQLIFSRSPSGDTDPVQAIRSVPLNYKISIDAKTSIPTSSDCPHIRLRIAFVEKEAVYRLVWEVLQQIVPILHHQAAIARRSAVEDYDFVSAASSRVGQPRRNFHR